MELEDWIRKELNNGIIESFEQTLKLPVCEHNVVVRRTIINGGGNAVCCVECGRIFDDGDLDQSQYDYDIDRNVWERHDSQGA